METTSLLDMWREGGWWMYPVFLVGAVAATAAIAHSASATISSFGAAAGSFALVVVLGAAGTLHSRHVVQEAVAFVAPEQKAEILEVGNKEAARPLQLAGIFAVIALVPLVLGEIRRAQRPASENAHHS